jgi:hypothetical protein
MINLSMTYEIWDEESAESGFEWQDVPHSFRELVGLIQNEGLDSASCSHGTPRWLSSSIDDVDYCTGKRTVYSLHPGNDAMNQKYWRKACEYLGINSRQTA